MPFAVGRIGEHIVIVITRNGTTTVLTGWRAWLAGVAIFVATVLLFAFIAFVMLGIAVTVGTILLIVVPVAIGIGLLVSLFRQPNRM